MLQLAEPHAPTVDDLVGMPWDDYIAELVRGERIWHDHESVRGLKAMRLAPTLAVYNALMAGQPVPSSELDPKWAKRYT